MTMREQFLRRCGTAGGNGTRRRPAPARRGPLPLVLLAGALLAAAACSSVQDELGMGKQVPDEFTVVTKAPLVIPPDFTLRPPRPGAKRPQEQQADAAARGVIVQAGGGQRATREASSAQAQQALTAQGFAAGGLVTQSASSAELALLNKAGAADADPEIREVVNRETTVLAQKDQSFTDRLIFWQEKPPPGSTLDATAEAQRLREAAAEGRPPSSGETPVITRRKRGWLEGIF